MMDRLPDKVRNAIRQIVSTPRGESAIVSAQQVLSELTLESGEDVYQFLEAAKYHDAYDRQQLAMMLLPIGLRGEFVTRFSRSIIAFAEANGCPEVESVQSAVDMLELWLDGDAETSEMAWELDALQDVFGELEQEHGVLMREDESDALTAVARSMAVIEVVSSGVRAILVGESSLYGVVDDFIKDLISEHRLCGFSTDDELCDAQCSILMAILAGS